MNIGDLVKMKDKRFHNELGVVIEKISHPRIHVKVHWADGFVLWEKPQWLNVVKKCP